ncbi:MAG: HD domain-containing protein [Bacteroidota bacterium]
MASFSGAGVFTNPFPLHPVDLFILGVFLVATLIVGLSYGRQVKTIQDYALGGKNFSTYTLVATLVATFASGSGFFVSIENAYTRGLYFIIPFLGAPLSLWLNGQLAMRMGEFMNHVSIADSMGSMYGKSVQIITAVSSIVARGGFMAIQFKIIARVIAILFNIQEEWATVLAASIVVFYSAFGGIKSVTFTDVLQFFTFGTLLPILGLVIWQNLQDPGQIQVTLTDNANYHVWEIINWRHPRFFPLLGLLLYTSIPHFQPELYQRMIMAKDVKQARRVLTYSAGALLLVYLSLWWIGVLLLADNPDLAKEEIVPFMVKNYTSPGILGLLGAGIIAMAMSTADSSLNAISVMFAHDLVKPLTKQVRDSVTIARIFSVVFGFLTLFLALYNQDVFSLVLFSVSFYLPVFPVPMLLAVLGFRTSTRAVLLGITAGILTVILWSVFVTNASGAIPSMFANMLVLLGSHYLLGEPGGWLQIDPNSPLGLERAARKETWKKRKEALKNFKLYPHLQQLLPLKEGSYTLFGIYALMATFIGLFNIGQAEVAAYEDIYTGISNTALWVTSAFITYPIWPPLLKSKRFIAFLWPLGMAAILLFTGTLLVILSHFHAVQVFVLVANFLLMTLLLRWPTAVFLTLLSVSSAALFFVQYTGQALPWEAIGPLQFRLFYGVLIFSGLLLAFFTYQDAYKQLGKKNEALQTREKDQQANLVQVSTEKQAALAALQYTGVERLLTITRELEAMHVTDEDKERMKALQTELLPIAFQLQGLNTRAQDYLRLQKAKMSLKGWCDEIKAAVVKQGVTARIHCTNKADCEQIKCDPQGLTTLLVNSIVLLSRQLESQPLEDTPPILFRLEDTQLSYPLEDVRPGYIKYIPAVRIAITVSDDLPVVKDNYSAELNGFNQPPRPKTAEELTRLANSRIVKSHYGYEEVTNDTLIYVVPVDVEDVRPQDMDNDYMEVGVMPKRANDHFKDEKNGIDAQAQEAAFLADVVSRSEANLDIIQTALETIKWYHGPKNRNSGEPFYLHPLTVAHIVLDYNADEATILGALLHDTVEDTPMQLDHIEDRFGKETAAVVDIVTHLQSIPHSIYKIKMSASENLQMLERTGNKRGLYVKIADRMHNMRTINGHNKVSKRRLIAQETADFFIPLAEKLGLKEAAAEFKDMCLEVLKQKD